MAGRRAWISTVTTEFQKSPLWRNVFFSFVLLGLEKFVEVEFVCPCDPDWNSFFAAAYFVVPAVMVFLLMMNIQGCKTNCCKCFTAICSSFVPSLVWLVLMFLDGRYFVCGETYWSGRFVVLAEAAPQKWCKPNDQDSIRLQNLMKISQEFASLSQAIGIGSIMILALPLLCKMCCKNLEEQNENQDSTHQERRDSEAFGMMNV